MKFCTLYTQEIISKKLYTIYKKLKPYLESYLHSFIMVLVTSMGKNKLDEVLMIQWQIINDYSDSKGSTLERIRAYYPKSLFNFNYYFCRNCSLLKMQLILMILNWNFKWFTPCSLLNHISKRNNAVFI